MIPFTLEEKQSFDGFTVLYRIKEGLYNDTYRVENEEGTSFFMKVFDPENPSCPKSDGMVAEILTCRRIKHENIISSRADGTFEHSGKQYPYLITDYFAGELLADRLNRLGKLPLSEAMDYTKGLVCGLRVLHANGLAHNDVTPRNIMLQEVGEANTKTTVVKLIDMAHTAQFCDSAPPFPTSDLDPFFRASETLNGRFNNKSDVYAAAAVLYSMLTGNAPWSFDTAGMERSAIMMKLKMRQMKDPDMSAIEENSFNSIKSTILAALKTPNDERFDIDDFEKALQGEIDIPAPHKDEGSEQGTLFQQGTPPQAAPPQTNEGDPVFLAEIKRGGGNGFKDIAGMEELKTMLQQKVIFVLTDRERAERYKLIPPNGMLLYGAPGCGKTFFAEKFAEETGFNFVLVKASDLGSTFVHGSQKIIADLFKKAEQSAPIVICFDEFDALVPNRSDISNTSVSGEVNEFLSQLNNCGKRQIFVVATSNRPDKIDPAVLRTGRIDKLVYVPLPDHAARREMFKLHMKGRPASEDIDYDRLADLTDKYISSDIAYIVNDAAMTAAFLGEPVTMQRLVDAVGATRSSLTQSTINEYENLRSRLEGISRQNDSERRRVGFV